MKKLMLFIILTALLNINAKANEPMSSGISQDTSTTGKTETTTETKEQRLDRLYPWHNSLFVSAGYGIPQGLRIELGYNIFTVFSLGINVGIADNWSRYPGKGTFGFFGILHLPFFKTKYTPYLLFCFGSSGKNGVGTDSSGNDSYTLMYFGCTVPVLPWLQCRPEAGAAFVSKYVSGGDITPELRSNLTKLGANLSFEVDLRKLW